MRFVSTLVLVAGLSVLVSPASAATLDQVKQKGFIQCGVSQGITGFSNPDDKGNWTGLDVDYCKAIAAAVFGDATKVKYVPTTASSTRTKNW